MADKTRQCAGTFVDKYEEEDACLRIQREIERMYQEKEREIRQHWEDKIRQVQRYCANRAICVHVYMFM